MTAAVAPSAIDRLTTDFLSRSPAHLIGGAWVPARAGRTFETVNPATGERLADVALGDAGDIDAAVQAARRALDGRWGKASHATRARLLFKLADLIEARAEEIALLETLDNGKPFRDAIEVDVASAVEDLPRVRRLGDQDHRRVAARPARQRPRLHACASRSAWPA